MTDMQMVLLAGAIISILLLKYSKKVRKALDVGKENGDVPGCFSFLMAIAWPITIVVCLGIFLFSKASDWIATPRDNG